ncbi:uncharacterized protein N7483_009399 [Penicillium malachiteum]|uniref:uncharacterized protein n=1 Tax=Penicillium malachiteum TaxID=1324776 RepID=UPI002549942E|nr:uncharacterized protein N7483_009399 [Penicillium malachiteum]KAJ5721465.1 hypothetical protein N7483_009399 [Penicillium malachiteum]
MIACFFLGSVVAYGLVMAIYRLHIHPLSKFPGPWLASVTGLYEMYFTAWGTESFEDKIDRMHLKYGPVVRITPDEIHVQEQFHNTNYADGWIKGSKALDSGRASPIRPRSISRMRSILQMEVRQIIRRLAQKHQVHRLFNARIQPLIPLGMHEPRVDPSDESELEDGYHNVARQIPQIPDRRSEIYTPASES